MDRQRRRCALFRFTHAADLPAAAVGVQPHCDPGPPRASRDCAASRCPPL